MGIEIPRFFMQIYVSDRGRTDFKTSAGTVGAGSTENIVIPRICVQTAVFTI